MQLPISSEKAIADEVLGRLEIIDPTCILAGGAPRDWWLGQSCNDLDFYVYTRGTTLQFEKNLKVIGFDVEPMRVQGHSVLDKVNGMYNSMPNIKSVYKTKHPYRGKEIQIIAMEAPTFEGVVDKFACSISKVWYKNGVVRPTVEAFDSRREKKIIVARGYGLNCKYVNKMRERFSDYSFEFTAFEVAPLCHNIF